MEIKLIERADIDDKRWNGCVHFALSATPYAYSWFLDIVCDDWLGLVVGNYKMVMPIVLAKKFGITYNYQPFFTQQLGIYADIPLSKETIDAFFDKIPKNIKYIDMALNESNFAPSQLNTITRVNYLLDLKLDYELIKSRYSSNILKHLKKAAKADLRLNTQISPEQFADFYKKNTAPKIKGFKDKHYYMMLRLIYKTLHYQMGILIGVENEKKELIAANFLINHPQRIINLMPTSNEEGLKKGAMSYLMNSIIEKNENQNKYLDFEGSMIEGVAQYFKAFGAHEVNFHHIKVNLLPNILRIFKK